MSEGKNRGTTFVVRLPLAKSADKRTRRRKTPLHTRIHDAASTAGRVVDRSSGKER